MAIMTFQMNILQRKAERAEQELKDIKDKHEQELRHERDLNTQKEKIIEQEWTSEGGTTDIRREHSSSRDDDEWIEDKN